MRHLVPSPLSLRRSIKCGCNPVRPQADTEFFYKGSLHAHQCRSLTGIVLDTRARPLSGIVRIRIYRSRSSLVTCRTPIFTDSERVSPTEYWTEAEISAQLPPAHFRTSSRLSTYGTKCLHPLFSLEIAEIDATYFLRIIIKFQN